MPRATSPAADAATPETNPPEPAEGTSTVDAHVATELGPPEPEWGNWRYTGDVERTYAHVPVTIAHGDVIHHLGVPALDGNWEPTDTEPTRQADNHPDTVNARHEAIEAALSAPKES